MATIAGALLVLTTAANPALAQPPPPQRIEQIVARPLTKPIEQQGLFKVLWEDPEYEERGTCWRGLAQLSEKGVETLVAHAKKYNVDGKERPIEQQNEIGEDQRLVMAHIIASPYRYFISQKARVPLAKAFGFPVDSVVAPQGGTPVAAGKITIPKVATEPTKFKTVDGQALAIDRLGPVMLADYAANKAYFEGGDNDSEKGLRALGLLRTYSEYMHSFGNNAPNLRTAREKLMEAYSQLPFAQVHGSKDYNGSGFGAAQSIVLGMDPCQLTKSFKKHESVDYTYVAMDARLAPAMKFVDEFRVASGLLAKAEAFESEPVLNTLLGKRQGRVITGGFNEKAPFATSSGVNFGVLFRAPKGANAKLLAKFDLIKQLPPKEGFEFPIDVGDRWGRLISSNPDTHQLIVVNAKGEKLVVEPLIERKDGKPVSWSARFIDSEGDAVHPDDVTGLIVNNSGQPIGDGRATAHISLGSWGYCNVYTAEQVVKGKYGVPSLDVDNIRIPINGKIVTIPKKEAQQIIDVAMPGLIPKFDYVGFRYNDDPKTFELKDGTKIIGRSSKIPTTFTKGTTWGNGAIVTIPNDGSFHGHVVLKNKDNWGPSEIEPSKIRSITRLEDGKVMIQVQSDEKAEGEKADKAPKLVEHIGELVTPFDWSGVAVKDGKKTVAYAEGSSPDGYYGIETGEKEPTWIKGSSIVRFTGEAMHELRPSEMIAFMQKHGGYMGKDSSPSSFVSNGVLQLNRIDITEEKGAERPAWLAPGALVGLHGPLVRQADDRMVFVRAVYGTGDDASSWMEGWMQIDKNNKIVNEGIPGSDPLDFAWVPDGKLDWKRGHEFNPELPADLPAKILVNGFAGMNDEIAARLSIPNWRSLRAPGDPPVAAPPPKKDPEPKEDPSS